MRPGSDAPASPSEQAARLARELARDAPARTERVVSSYRGIAGYSSLDAGAVATDVTSVARANGRLFLHRLQGIPPGEADRRLIAEGAVRRLELGLELDDVLHAYRVWTMATWTEVTACAARLPGVSPAGMAHIAGLAFEHTEYVSGLAADAFRTEERGLWVADDPLRGDALTRCLAQEVAAGELDAHEARCLPNRDDRPLTVVLVAARPNGAGVARRNRAVRAVIDRWRDAVGGAGLVAVDERIAILIGSFGDDGWEPVLDEGDHAAITMVASSPLPTLAAAFAAYGELREMLEVAHRLPSDRAPLTWRDTLVTALTASASTHVSARLDGIVRVLDGYETRYSTPLTETLELFLRDGLGVRACAQRLSCHPNTVRYRLHRVGTLTGLDPYRPPDNLILRLALAWRSP